MPIGGINLSINNTNIKDSTDNETPSQEGSRFINIFDEAINTSASSIRQYSSNDDDSNTISQLVDGAKGLFQKGFELLKGYLQTFTSEKDERKKKEIKEAGEEANKSKKELEDLVAKIKALDTEINNADNAEGRKKLEEEREGLRSDKVSAAIKYNNDLSEYTRLAKTNAYEGEKLYHYAMDCHGDEDPTGELAERTTGGQSTEGKIAVNIGGETNTEKAVQIADAAREIASNRDTVGWCYKGVADAIESVSKDYHFLSGGSAYMAADQIAAQSNFTEITSRVPTGKDLKNLPAGAIVVWSKYDGGPHGHISVALGGGKEASDHIQDQITSMGGETGKYRVFMPK